MLFRIDETQANNLTGYLFERLAKVTKPNQSPSNKVLRWTLFMKQNLRFGSVGQFIGE